MIHFYHLWLGGNWKPIAQEHFNALRAAEFDGEIHVGLVGSPEARAEAQKWLDRQWKWQLAAEADEGFEDVTLHALHNAVKKLPGATPILYAHNKGTFHAHGENEAWRRAMTEHLVDQWGDRVRELTEMHQIDVGTNCALFAEADVASWYWLPAGTYDIGRAQPEVIEIPMSAGNFWWARADYLQKLPKLPPVLTIHNRIQAEVWLGRNDPRVHSAGRGWPKVTIGHWEQRMATPGFPHTAYWAFVPD